MTKNLEYYYNKNKELIKKIKLNPKHKANYEEAMHQFKLYHTTTEEKDKYIQFCLKSSSDKYMKTISCTPYEIFHTDILSQVVEYSLIHNSICYMTFAKYSEKYSRKECYAESFNTYIIDFDFYHESKFSGLSPEEFWNELKHVIGKYPYSAVFSSGRGLYVSFIFKDTVNCSDNTFKANHKTLIQNLLLELEEYGADVKCKDFSRVFKLAGTIHPKTGNISKLIEETSTRSSYEDFSKILGDILVEETPTSLTGKKSKIKKVKLENKIKKVKFIKKENLAKLHVREQFRYEKAKKIIPYKYGYKTGFQDNIEKVANITEVELKDYYIEQLDDILKSFRKNMVINPFMVENNHWINDLLHCDSSIQEKTFYDCISIYESLNKGRVHDIEKLVTLRKGDIECRNNLLLVYGIQLWFERNTNILEKMLNLNKKFQIPYAVKEVTRIYEYVMKNAEYVKNGQFNFVYFPYKSASFITVFQITTKELEQLTYWNPKHCIGGMYSKRIKRCITKNQNKFLKEKRNESMTYDMKHMSVYDVAKKYNCCVQTVYNNTKFHVKEESMKQEISFIGNMKKLGCSKKYICDSLSVSKSTINRRLKKFKNKPSKTYKNSNNFVKTICDTEKKEKYQEAFVNYIKENKEIFSLKLSSLNLKWNKTHDKQQDVQKSIFTLGITYWTLLSGTEDIHSKDYLIKVWNYIEEKNNLSKRALTKLELLNIYIAILKNHKNLILGNIENLYLPYFL